MSHETERRADQPRLLRRAVALCGLYALGALVGGALFVGLMRAVADGLGPGLLFYRGVCVLGVVFLLLFALMLAAAPIRRRFGIDGADALGASIVAVSLLTAGFVLGPVTVDRSISVFLLSRFEAADHPLTEEEARAAFSNLYVNEWAQIDRRLAEQRLSGNLESGPAGWRLTSQGRAFMRTARVISALFGGDPRFVGR